MRVVLHLGLILKSGHVFDYQFIAKEADSVNKV